MRWAHRGSRVNASMTSTQPFPITAIDYCCAEQKPQKLLVANYVLEQVLCQQCEIFQSISVLWLHSWHPSLMLSRLPTACIASNNSCSSLRHDNLRSQTLSCPIFMDHARLIYEHKAHNECCFRSRICCDFRHCSSTRKRGNKNQFSKCMKKYMCAHIL